MIAKVSDFDRAGDLLSTAGSSDPSHRAAWNKAWRAARLSRRAIRALGPHQYAIEGWGRDAYEQPNVWHVDLTPSQPPHCDCPAALRDPQCKHVVFFQFVEAMLRERPPVD